MYGIKHVLTGYIGTTPFRVKTKKAHSNRNVLTRGAILIRTTKKVRILIGR